MQRRHFLTRLGSLLAALGAAPASARVVSAVRVDNRPPLHLQDCRIAGSHHYDCEKVLARLRPGQPLQLHRQPANPHDRRAIEVLWHGRKLGYLPRLDNAAAASLLDRAHALRAEILGVDDPDEQWEPVRLRVWVSIHPHHPEAKT